MTKEDLKTAILQQVAEYYRLVHAPQQQNSFVQKRKGNYVSILNGVKGIPWLHIQKTLTEAEPFWFDFLMPLCPFTSVTCNELAEHLEKNKIQPRKLFAGNLMRHPCFETLEEDKDYRVAAPLVNTGAIMNGSLWVGAYLGMTRAHSRYIRGQLASIVCPADPHTQHIRK